MRNLVLVLGAVLGLVMLPVAPATAAGFALAKPDTAQLGSAAVTISHRGKRHHARRTPLYFYSSAPYYYRYPPHAYRSHSYSAWRQSSPPAVYSSRRIYHWRHRPWW